MATTDVPAHPSPHWPLPNDFYAIPSNKLPYAGTASEIFSTIQHSTRLQLVPAAPELSYINAHNKLNPDSMLRDIDSEVAAKEPQTASKLEKWTLAALSRIFEGKQFIKVRPPWLRNPRTGRACELDFYNDELRLAVEVQGMQHYVYPNSWHKNRAEFEEQVYRDRLKEDLCKQAGIMLVHVPLTVQQKGVEIFIHEEMQRLRIPIT